VDFDREMTGRDALAENAFNQKPIQHPRKKRQDINRERHRRAGLEAGNLVAAIRLNKKSPKPQRLGD
jgi:hypothetical protein